MYNRTEDMSVGFRNLKPFMNIEINKHKEEIMSILCQNAGCGLNHIPYSRGVQTFLVWELIFV